ncbi:MAG: hypothetical protein KDA46_07710, partial [Parvularculaceae bacterium]|nr:hypothetical protein [Parvularculaceae bacterium]
AVMAQIPAFPFAQEYASGIEKAGMRDVLAASPSRRTESRYIFCLARTPNGTGYRGGSAQHSAGGCNSSAAHEHIGRVRFERVPPFKKQPGIIDGQVESDEPRRA